MKRGFGKEKKPEGELESKRGVEKKRERELEMEEKHESTSEAIGRFHTLFKQVARSGAEKAEKEKAIELLGGLAEYQRLSLLGVDSSLFVLEELKTRLAPGSHVDLLDVGAIVHRYPKKSGDLRISATSIDLYSTDNRVEQIDFFEFAKKSKIASFDVVVLSLVLNYVASPIERGKMLMESARLLRPGGHCFLILPVSCISNSRYFKFSWLKRLLARVGLIIPDSKGFTTTEKFFMATCVRGDEVKGVEGFETEAIYKRKLCRGGKERNNFCILLPEPLSVARKRAKIDLEKMEVEHEKKVFPEGAKNLKTTSNQRRRARQKKLKETKEASKKESAQVEKESNVENVIDF